MPDIGLGLGGGGAAAQQYAGQQALGAPPQYYGYGPAGAPAPTGAPVAHSGGVGGGYGARTPAPQQPWSTPNDPGLEPSPRSQRSPLHHRQYYQQQRMMQPQPQPQPRAHPNNPGGTEPLYSELYRQRPHSPARPGQQQPHRQQPQPRRNGQGSPHASPFRDRDDVVYAHPAYGPYRAGSASPAGSHQRRGVSRDSGAVPLQTSPFIPRDVVRDVHVPSEELVCRHAEWVNACHWLLRHKHLSKYCDKPALLVAPEPGDPPATATIFYPDLGVSVRLPRSLFSLTGGHMPLRRYHPELSALTNADQVRIESQYQKVIAQEQEALRRREKDLCAMDWGERPPIGAAAEPPPALPTGYEQWDDHLVQLLSPTQHQPQALAAPAPPPQRAVAGFRAPPPQNTRSQGTQAPAGDADAPPADVVLGASTEAVHGTLPDDVVFSLATDSAVGVRDIVDTEDMTRRNLRKMFDNTK